MQKRSNKPNKVCEFCGVAYHVKPSHLATARFCSKACFDMFQRRKGKTVPCATCGSPTYVSPSLIRDRNFCSNECRLTWWSTYLKEEVNVKGHSVGHKAPHLTELNIKRNPKLAIEEDAIYRGKYTTHRKVMEEHLGRKLEPWEDVHHINGIHNDNRIENLQVIPHREHMKLHWQIAKERGVI